MEDNGEPHSAWGSLRATGIVNDSVHDKLEALAKLFEEHRLEELIVEVGDLKVHLRRDSSNPGTAAAKPPSDLEVAGLRGSQLEPHLENISRTVAIRAPLIGMFYRAASPDSPPLVEIGDLVKEGQTVCVVEAMKVFNEIKSDWAGRVKDVPAENGSLVQAGDPLVVLEFLEGH